MNPIEIGPTLSNTIIGVVATLKAILTHEGVLWVIATVALAKVATSGISAFFKLRR